MRAREVGFQGSFLWGNVEDLRGLSTAAKVCGVWTLFGQQPQNSEHGTQDAGCRTQEKEARPRTTGTGGWAVFE